MFSIFSIFEDLWRNGVDAEDKIREIEEGLQPIRTRILESQGEIVKQIKNLNNTADRLSIWGFEIISKISKFRNKEKQKEEFDRLRWIINVDKGSIQLVKEFLDLGFQIRHVKNMIPLNFGLSVCFGFCYLHQNRFRGRSLYYIDDIAFSDCCSCPCCCCWSLRTGQSWGSPVSTSSSIFLPVLWLTCLSLNLIGCPHIACSGIMCKTIYQSVLLYLELGQQTSSSSSSFKIVFLVWLSTLLLLVPVLSFTISNYSSSFNV